MKFELNYNNLEKLDSYEYEVYEEEKTLLEDLYIVRNALGEFEHVYVTIICLGEKWNVSKWDMPLLAEHFQKIYEIFGSVKGYNYLMCYYDEGVDRKLKFTKTDSDTIKIENVSGDKWISPLQFEDIKMDDLKNQIHNFVNKIKEAVEIIYPELNQLEMLQQWYKSFEV